MGSRDALALFGGPKLRAAPFPSWPHYAADEIAAVQRALASGKVNQWTGEECTSFEREYAAALGVPHAIALANGTVALELALRALGVGAGDEVVVPSRTFIATASAVVAVGARPVCADVDRDSGNLTPETIRAQLTPRTKAVIPVHLGGWPCEMPNIMALARERGLFVVEDCAQANGAALDGKPVGTFSDAAAFSFCQDKIITTGGEGGMLVTSDASVWERAWSYKDHGKSFRSVFHAQHPPGFRWLHESFGTNWRMTELQATIGRAQLRKLDAWSAARAANAAILRKYLADAPALRVPEPTRDVQHANYRQYAYVDPVQLPAGWDRDQVIAAIAAEGVPCFSGSCGEIYMEKAFMDAGLAPRERFPVARELAETSLAFPTHPTMSPEDAHDIGAAVQKVLREASR